MTVIDAVLVAGVVGGGLYLALIHLTPIRPGAAGLLAVLTAGYVYGRKPRIPTLRGWRGAVRRGRGR